MKSYFAPGWGPTPVFEEWAANTVEQVGPLALLAAALLVVVLLSLRWRAASSGKPSDEAEHELGLGGRKARGGERMQSS